MKKRTTWKGLKKGTRFRVIANTLGHNYVIGKVYKMSMDGTEHAQMNNIAEGHPGNTISIADCEILGPETITDLRNQIIDLKAKIKETESKIEFCEIHELKEYDEETHRLYEAVKIVEAASTPMQKAIALRKLISE